MHIVYCEKCSAKVRGEPVVDPSTSARYCSACAAQMPELSKGAESSPKPARISSSRQHAVRTTPGGGNPQSNPVPAQNTQPPPAFTQTGGNMAFYFCESCGRRINSRDIEEGRARNKRLNGMYCADCAKGVNTMAFDAISIDDAKAIQREIATSKTPARAGGLAAQYSARARQKSADHEPKKKPVAGRLPLVFGVIGTTLIVLIATFLFSRRKPDQASVVKPQETASVTTTSLAPSNAAVAASSAQVSPAVQQLAKIKAMITPDLRAYAEARALLEQFPSAFAGTPEADTAKALLSEIDTACAKLADEALSNARTKALSGGLAQAESDLRTIESRFGKGAWFESKGKASIAEVLAEIASKRAAGAEKSVAATLDKARVELQSGRLEEASKLIADREKWPPELRTEANKIAVEIEAQMAAVAAARKLENERDALLAEFDRLMIAGNHSAARDYAKSKADAGGPIVEILRDGEHLACKLIEEPAARIRGASTLIGRGVRLNLTSGTQDATIKAVTDSGLTVGIAYRINNEIRQNSRDIRWDALHQNQKTEYARLGGCEMSAADVGIMAAYAALASNRLEEAGKALGGGNGSPLQVHVATVVAARSKQLVYESTMTRAKGLLAAKKFKDAAGECSRALQAKPGDENAAALLSEVQHHLSAPQTLTLDLGNGVTMDFIYIRPGTFVMGGTSTSEGRFEAVETPKHTVTITKGFYLGKYEVTQAQFQAIMGSNPSKSTKEPQCPVGNVPWDQNLTFCKKASAKTGRDVRLPTEAEWEFACRAGSDTDWSHGSDPGGLGACAWIASNSSGRVHPVGQKKPNAWGLYDMYGNVCERVADFYERSYYANSPKEDPTGAKGTFGNGNNGTTIVRGGTFKSGPDDCKSGKRGRGGGYACYEDWGFRVALTAAGTDAVEK